MIVVAAMVISNCLSLAFDYGFLMIVYGPRRSIWKVTSTATAAARNILYL
jgi:hypothetical protein